MHPYADKLNKSPLREKLNISPLRHWSAFPPQADHVLVELFSSMAARGTLQDGALPPPQLGTLMGASGRKGYAGTPYYLCKSFVNL